MNEKRRSIRKRNIAVVVVRIREEKKMISCRGRQIR